MREVSNLCRMPAESLFVKVAFEQRPEGSEGVSQAGLWKKSFPSRRNSKCKDLGAWHADMREQQEGQYGSVKWTRESSGSSGTPSQLGSWVCDKNFGFYTEKDEEANGVCVQGCCITLQNSEEVDSKGKGGVMLLSELCASISRHLCDWILDSHCFASSYIVLLSEMGQGSTLARENHLAIGEG